MWYPKICPILQIYLVEVLKGKEKGQVYFAFYENLEGEDAWYLIDGKKYGLQKPKKKNKKHLRIFDEVAFKQMCDWEFCPEHYTFQKKMFGIGKKLSSRNLKQLMKEQKKKTRKLRMLFERNFENRPAKKQFRIWQNKQKQANAEIRQKLMQVRKDYAIIKED